jgi:hypothetical protein
LVLLWVLLDFKLGGSFLSLDRLAKSHVELGQHRTRAPHLVLSETIEPILLNVNELFHYERLTAPFCAMLPFSNVPLKEVFAWLYDLNVESDAVSARQFTQFQRYPFLNGPECIERVKQPDFSLSRLETHSQVLCEEQRLLAFEEGVLGQLCRHLVWFKLQTLRK